MVPKSPEFASNSQMSNSTYLLMLLKINEVGFEPANISLITLKSNNIPAFLIKEGYQAISTWSSMGITRFNTCSISLKALPPAIDSGVSIISIISPLITKNRDP